MVIRAQSDPELKDILNKKSKLNLADSVGLLWAAKFDSLPLPKDLILKKITIVLQWIITLIMLPILPRWFKKPIVDRISGSDFVWPLAKLAAKEKYRIFLLGGAATVAERAALKLQTDIYDLRIAGVSSGSPDDTNEIVEVINKSRADILLVAFGSPKQEIWLNRNLARTCCKIGMGIGGTFDFIAGEKKRAPLWMRKTGLEWFFRLVHEPSRFKRQLSIPKFMWIVLANRLKKS